MTAPVQARVEGEAELRRNFDRLQEKVQKRALRRGTTKAAQAVHRAAKSAARRQTGLLQKSLGYKVTVKILAGRAVAFARIGPRRGFRQKVLRTPKGVRVLRKKELGIAKAHNLGQYRDPVRYAHLVEKGHGGPHAAGAFPFLGPAFERTKTQGREAIAQECRAAVRESAV
jgi:HK97 gp10 family phage protein